MEDNPVSSKRKYNVVCQQWEESERGWGVRPDRFSLHLNHLHCEKFVKAHNDRLPKNFVPDEYSRVSGSPFVVEVDQYTYNLLLARKSTFGMYGKGNTTPPRVTITLSYKQ